VAVNAVEPPRKLRGAIRVQNIQPDQTASHRWECGTEVVANSISSHNRLQYVCGVPRIIWTPEGIKIALYDRPTDTGRISENSGVNRNSDVSLEFGDWLPVPAICENWTSSFLFLNKPKKEKDLQNEDEPALHPIHLAVEFQKLLDEELVNSRSDLAKRYLMSRARVTQVMRLLELPTEV
jgi:hypothetical protein